MEELGVVLSGRARILMDDGREVEIGPGQAFAVGPGHDSWVAGDERYVSLHLLGADEYATRSAVDGRDEVASRSGPR